MRLGELTEWTVVLINNKDNQDVPTKNCEFGGGMVVGLRERNNAVDGQTTGQYRIKKDHWISPDDEWLDLDDEQFATAMNHTIALWERSTRKDNSEVP